MTLCYLQWWLRIGSVCVRLMDVHMYGVDRMSIVFGSAFSHDTQPHLRLHGVGAISYNSGSHLMFLQGKVNNPRYIAQVVNPKLLPFIWQVGDVHLQQDNACPHMAAMMQCAHRGIQQLPWPARSPDLLSIERVWDMIKRELTFSRGCHNHWWISTTVYKMFGSIFCRMTFSSFMTICMQVYIACAATRGGYTVYWCDCLGTPDSDMCVSVL